MAALTLADAAPRQFGPEPPFKVQTARVLWEANLRRIGGLKLWRDGNPTVKKDIHPKYVETLVKCGCGNSFKTRSTVPAITVDICNACHPFYTGKLKFVDAAGRIEKFQNKFGESGYASVQRGKKANKKAEATSADS